MYFEIKRLDVERVDIERSEGAMTDHDYAATPWEVEAERRREVLAGDARDGVVIRRDPAREILALARGRRLLSRLRSSTEERPAQAGKLNQKRV
jgi:hypothetical protein